MSSKYWDNFEAREKETASCLKNNKEIPIMRVSVHITNRCNFRCKYCNMKFGNDEMNQTQLENIIKKYGKDVIYHITGGEPSTVSWLYDFIDNTKGITFHLNTNAYLLPPKNIKRLKVSLDTQIEEDFNSLVQNKNAFKRVVENIKLKSSETITSITTVLSKQTYENAPAFMKYCRKEFPNLYAVFFSCYKGRDKRFLMNKEDIDSFFKNIKPRLEREMDNESRELFNETIEEKFRLIAGTRFPENESRYPCYLSMSERVIDFSGNEYNCSHLYRDGIKHSNFSKHTKCLFGCNRRLVKFNEDVKKLLSKRIPELNHTKA